MDEPHKVPYMKLGAPNLSGYLLEASSLPCNTVNENRRDRTKILSSGTTVVSPKKSDTAKLKESIYFLHILFRMHLFEMSTFY